MDMEQVAVWTPLDKIVESEIFKPTIVHVTVDAETVAAMSAASFAAMFEQIFAEGLAKIFGKRSCPEGICASDEPGIAAEAAQRRLRIEEYDPRPPVIRAAPPLPVAGFDHRLGRWPHDAD